MVPLAAQSAVAKFAAPKPIKLRRDLGTVNSPIKIGSIKSGQQRAASFRGMIQRRKAPPPSSSSSFWKPYVKLPRVKPRTLSAIVRGFKSAKNKPVKKGGKPKSVKSFSKTVQQIEKKLEGLQKKPVVAASWDTKL